MDTTVADPMVGRVLEGRYAVLSRIARGGMASVYLAVDQRLDREVALKVMHPDLALDEDFLRRFIREARSAARLSHPGVVAVYDQGQDNGSWYLVMEHVPGRTLRDLINERGRLTPREALGLLDPVLDALAAAHWTGIIHRDIKPENVLLADDGRVKVADFGLARAITTASTNHDSKVLLGTVAYLAPEQVERGVADARSDVYAVGILLFEMLTGRKPFQGETPIQVAYQHVHSDVPAPSTVVPGLAPAVDALVRRAAARDPDARPADAGDLLVEVRRTRASLTPDELDGLAPPASSGGGDPTMRVPAARSFVVPGGPGSPAHAATNALRPPTAATGVLDLRDPPRGAQPRAPRRRRRGRVAALIIVILALLLGAAGWYVGAGPGSKIPMPNVIKASLASAERTLEAKGLHYRPVSVFSESATVGAVVSTDPAPGQSVSKHGTVVLDVSKGPERDPVPDIGGLTQAQAESAITGGNLAVGEVNNAFSDTVKKGSVISVDPPVGTQVKPNTPVNFVISSGRAPVPLADWTNKPATLATRTLENSGLQVHTTLAYNDAGIVKGNVVSQTPGAGTVGHGSTVTLVVSQGPPLVEVPKVTSKQVDAARQILQQAGFKVHVRKLFGGIFGTVRFESPDGGSMQPKGSTITITIV